MSAVELAVRKVKNLSEREAGELLAWLDAQPARARKTSRPKIPADKAAKALARRKLKMAKFWDSVRRTTDWEIPRMPGDLVHKVKL